MAAYFALQSFNKGAFILPFTPATDWYQHYYANNINTTEIGFELEVVVSILIAAI